MRRSRLGLIIGVTVLLLGAAAAVFTYREIAHTTNTGGGLLRGLAITDWGLFLCLLLFMVLPGALLLIADRLSTRFPLHKKYY